MANFDRDVLKTATNSARAREREREREDYTWFGNSFILFLAIRLFARLFRGSINLQNQASDFPWIFALFNSSRYFRRLCYSIKTDKQYTDSASTLIVARAIVSPFNNPLATLF